MTETQTETKQELTPQQASRIMRERLNAIREQTLTGDDAQLRVLMKYPRLVAHLICHSSGYFTPRSAANAINRHKDAQPFHCEWYWSMSGNGSDLLQIGRNALLYAFHSRHSHRGYMCDYWQARMVCLAALKGNDPIFASWF